MDCPGSVAVGAAGAFQVGLCEELQKADVLC